MTFIKAKFTTADECDRALGELVGKMCVTNSEIVSFDGKSSGDLPINYPDTPIADYSSADWLTGKSHILEGSNVSGEHNEFADKTSVLLKFSVSDKNSSRAHKILLSHKAFDIKSKAYKRR